MLALKQLLKKENQLISATISKEIARLDPVIQPLIRHSLEAGGKRIRPGLTVLVGKAFGCRAQGLYELGCAVEFLHNATLIHDDIMDGASLRRSHPATHTVFGPKQAIMAGDVLLAASMLIIIRQQNMSIIERFAEAVAKTAAGQVKEIQSLHNAQMTADQYMEIITGKTAYLISSASEVGAVYAGADGDRVAAAAEFGLQIGIAFQLVDDALDIAPEEEIGKPTGGDLREGKFTPVLERYLESLPDQERETFCRLFSQGGLSEEHVQKTVLAMRALNCGEKTRKLADAHIALAETALEKFPPGVEREALFKVAHYIRTRKS
ncbi:MAG: polyprenyl synthetase family protein [Deltaproteobacteria bacterium]|jgi:octaprenyl-diphosphate synthase|nr:polyprenyl synthetase family protein [Deltaproteobacteria bacterium]